MSHLLPGGNGENQDNQKWTFEALSGGDAGTYRIRSVYSNKCIVILSASLLDGGQLIENDCNNTDNEKWWIEPFNRNFAIRNKYSGKVLDNENRDEWGLQIRQFSWNQGLNQQWMIVEVSNTVQQFVDPEKQYKIVSAQNGLNLDLIGPQPINHP